MIAGMPVIGTPTGKKKMMMMAGGGGVLVTSVRRTWLPLVSGAAGPPKAVPGRQLIDIKHILFVDLDAPI